MKNKSFANIFKYSKKYIKIQFFLLIPTVIAVLFPLIRPIVIKQFIDNILNKDIKIILSYVFLLLGIVVVERLINFFSNNLLYKTINNISSKEKVSLFKKIFKLSLKDLKKYTSGDILSRVLQDTDELSQTISIVYLVIFANILQLISAAFLLFSFSYKLAIIAYSTLPLFYITSKLFDKKIKNSSINERKTNSVLIESFREKLSGFKTIIGFSKKDHFLNQFEDDSIKDKNAKNKLIFYTRAQDEFISFIYNLIPILILGIGGLLVQRKEISLGTLIAFYSYIGWLNHPIQMLSNIVISVKKSKETLKRIEEIYNLPEDEHNGNDLLESIKNIELKNISFSYEDKEIIKNINLNIVSNNKYSIVGESGSGKSTLLNLLPLFYKDFSGNIFINNKNIKEYDINSLHKKILYVSQNEFILNDTLKENIFFGDTFSEKDIKKAIEYSCINDFLPELEDGMKTVLGENGSNLSDGQKQRITIARAIIRKPDLLILDESTNAIDSKTEEKIFDSISKIIPTIIIISHRLSTIKKAENIIIINDGKVLSKGSHKDLLENCKEYSRNIESQLLH
ncbi:ABC transporter ATP-binding protein [Tepiditoga spiralis]|uniref:ABC transporter ATP-binding protein n=1 Tax=Tepiditoga spiralis TaxID=2108365 RepID=A0A7G1G1L3_9BACT|nr:ABC transporter ATP-binding protein [Tepiditoga spiralis]BBE30068.1 ABC transporter ATP-binding protein [Tepiditoga spiralis]